MLPLHTMAGGGRGAASVASSSLRRHASGGAFGDDWTLGSGGPGFSLFEYLRRVVYFQQMDVGYTLTQMGYLLHSPSKVYKLTSWRNQTKNQWARDDPAFVVLLCALLAASSVLFGLALGAGSVGALLWLVAQQLLLFFGTGVAMASLGSFLANHYFRARHSHSVDQEVEWMYAFDIHCNAYFPLAVALYGVQLLLLPVLLSDKFVATLVANALWATALSYYHYVSFLGYMYLPFLNKELVTSMLYPVAGVLLVAVLLTVFNVSAARLALSCFFTLTY